MTTLRIRQNKDYNKFADVIKEENSKCLELLSEIYNTSQQLIQQDKDNNEINLLHNISDKYTKLYIYLDKLKMDLRSNLNIIDGIKL